MKIISTSARKGASMDVLLSIKPKFADKIFSGQKRYEFRKTKFRSPDSVDTIYMYASSPVQRIVGAFTTDGIVSDNPTNLWDKYGDCSGVANRDQFMNYFEGTSEGYAIGVKDVHELDQPINPKDHVKNFSPPVSFYYLESNSQFDLSKRFPARITGSKDLLQYSSD